MNTIVEDGVSGGEKTPMACSMNAIDTATVRELYAAASALIAPTFEDARANEDRRRLQRRLYEPMEPERLWCMADPLNPCWIPGTPYTGQHWGSEPGRDQPVCEYCRLRAAVANMHVEIAAQGNA